MIWCCLLWEVSQASHVWTGRFVCLYIYIYTHDVCIYDNDTFDVCMVVCVCAYMLWYICIHTCTAVCPYDQSKSAQGPGMGKPRAGMPRLATGDCSWLHILAAVGADFSIHSTSALPGWYRGMNGCETWIYEYLRICDLFLSILQADSPTWEALTDPEFWCNFSWSGSLDRPSKDSFWCQRLRKWSKNRNLRRGQWSQSMRNPRQGS